MRVFAFLIVVALAVGCGAEPAGPALAPGSPNVIFIVMDTTSAERCSVNGYSRPTTPALEKIAKGGLNFRNAWSPSGWTGPAHASMFTGLRPENHGFHHGNRQYLLPTATTLTEHLGGAGYATGCFTNNGFISPEHGLSAGFDLYAPLWDQDQRQYPYAIETHEKALAWVRKKKAEDAPFFLFINDIEPHLLYMPLKDYLVRFVDPEKADEALAAAKEMDGNQILKHSLGTVPLDPFALSIIPDLYDAEIACLDHEIGKLIDRLGAEGLLENTLLIITSDHGENLGRHGLLDHMFGLHRTLLYVPLIVRLPDGSRAGEVRDEVVRLEDIFPTVLEVCGLPVPEGIDGESLLGSLGGRIARATRGSPEEFLNGMERAMSGRAGFERLLVDTESEFDGRIHTIEYSDGRKLVFDVLTDPEELHPIQE